MRDGAGLAALSLLTHSVTGDAECADCVDRNREKVSKLNIRLRSGLFGDYENGDSFSDGLRALKL